MTHTDWVLEIESFLSRQLTPREAERVWEVTAYLGPRVKLLDLVREIMLLGKGA
jgi:hypothetical protein